MKVRVSYTVEVDPEGWVSEYGVDPSEVRDDVKDHLHTCGVEHLASLGLLA